MDAITETEPANAPAPLPTTVDLSGLPEPVVREVLRYVEDARRADGWAVRVAAGDPLPIPVRFASIPPTMTREEFKAQLDKMAAMGANDPPLPPDFDPRDLYDEDDGL